MSDYDRVKQLVDSGGSVRVTSGPPLSTKDNFSTLIVLLKIVEKLEQIDKRLEWIENNTLAKVGGGPQ